MKDEGVMGLLRPHCVSGGSGLLGGRGPLSPSAPGLYWACQVSEKNPRAENSLQTGLHGWPGAVSGLRWRGRTAAP